MIKLLVVDDSALMRKLLTGIFQEQGDFEVRTARNGAEALAEIEAFAPDVVTLDVNMPEMDGLTCLSRIIVEAPRPVVMVSSLTTESASATLEALHLGAVDFIAKPDGTISLSIERIKDELVAKVRAAAAVRLKPTLRLAERIRHQISRTAPAQRAPRRAPRPKPAAAPAAAAEALPGLVLVGASTGGPRALEIVLTALPADLPWPVLVAQHMPGNFTGMFARRLDDCCAIAVQEVTRPTILQPGNAYIAGGDADMVVARRPHGLVAMSAPESSRYRWHPSVDRLVASALEHMPPERVVAVLLTGMGNDGARTMASVKAGGGFAIAEAESTAVVWGMPGELVRAGGADLVLPVEAIAEAIVERVT